MIRALVIALLTALLAVPAHGAEPRIWYVDESARAGGNGSATAPFRSLGQVERASRRGDTIRVVPSSLALDGGIRLKRNQTLVGLGRAATALLTNTTTHLAGDAVRLADGATVRNLRIVGAQRGAIYGIETTGVQVIGNDISRHNASCTPGFLIPPFNAPTNVPGIGIPISAGLQNGWAGIMIDAASTQHGTALIAGNTVHDAECGDGIDVRTSGTASYDVRIVGNTIHSLRQGPDFQSLLAIGLQARDHSALTAIVRRNLQRELGNPDDLNLAVEGADSEGVFVNGVGPSRIRAVVTRNRYENRRGLGGFSANGLEMVTMGNGSRASVVIRNSHFSGSPGDVIEEGALGTNAVLEMVVDRVVAERSRGVGNTFVLPFNNGDCLLAGSLGAGNDVRLVVRDSVLRNCANNGLSVGSNVVNGSGPTKSISVTVLDSAITGNRGGNLGIRNFTALDALSVTVRRTNLAGSSSIGSSVADFAAENLGTVGRHLIDASGGNCLWGGLLAASVLGFDVLARQNWWGQPGGPGLLRTLVTGGSLDTSAPLSAAPAPCV